VVLPTVLILGVIIIGLVLAGIFVAQLINRSNFNIRLAAEASAAVKSALSDAHLRLLRGDLMVTKSCPGFSVTPNYSLPSLGRVNSDVYVCQTTCPLSTNICQYEVRADAQALVVLRRRLEAVLNVDPITGVIKLSSLKQVSL